jgi:hypothetical protein
MTPIYALTLINGSRACRGESRIEKLTQATDAELDMVYPSYKSSPYDRALQQGAEAIMEKAHQKWDNEAI